MSLPVFQATIVNDSGDIIPSAVITVLDEITGLGLTIYSDRAGTVPLGTNGVFTAGTDGFAQFFAPAGNYRVKAEQAASGFEKTWDFVPLVGTGAFRDVQTSPTDTTAGALMAAGAVGWASDTRLLSSNASSEDISGIYGYDAGASNVPDGGLGGAFFVLPRNPVSAGIRKYNLLLNEAHNLFIQKNTNGVDDGWVLANQNTFYQKITEGAGAPNITLGFDENTIEEGTNSRANTISGGGYTDNTNRITGIETRYSTISGGYDNYINGTDATEGLDSTASTISGGAHHVIKATHSNIAGGSYGTIEAGATYSTISGGTQNTIGTNASLAQVLGGAFNSSLGENSMTWGRNATASGKGSLAFCSDEGVGNSLSNSLLNSAAFRFSNGYRFIGKIRVCTDGTYSSVDAGAQIEIDSVGASTTSGDSQLLRLAGTRFGFRLHDDSTLVLDRATGGTWQADPILGFSRASGHLGIGQRPSANSVLSVKGLPVYADNAAAISGGLATDDIYKTATGALRIVV